MAQDCREPKRNRGRDAPMNEEKMKIFQDMMVKCNKKSEDFSKGDDYQTKRFLE